MGERDKRHKDEDASFDSLNERMLKDAMDSEKRGLETLVGSGYQAPPIWTHIAGLAFFILTGIVLLTVLPNLSDILWPFEAGGPEYTANQLAPIQDTNALRDTRSISDLNIVYEVLFFLVAWAFFLAYLFGLAVLLYASCRNLIQRLTHRGSPLNINLEREKPIIAAPLNIQHSVEDELDIHNPETESVTADEAFSMGRHEKPTHKSTHDDSHAPKTDDIGDELDAVETAAAKRSEEEQSGDGHFKHQEYEEALILYTKASEKYGESPRLNKMIIASNFNIGVHHVKHRRYPKALEHMEHILAKDPYHERAAKTAQRLRKKIKKTQDLMAQYTQSRTSKQGDSGQGDPQAMGE
jgi:tetratricopeptide (TPR) repeat protein